MTREDLRNKIFDVDASTFNDLSLQIFRYQYFGNEIYQRYCSLLKRTIENVLKAEDIPFLPIEFFKTHKVITGKVQYEKIFTSSGTTGSQVSKHYVADMPLYEESFLRSFELFFGTPEKYCILALLPSYLEREGSSLVHMVKGLMDKSAHPQNGFYLHDHASLAENIKHLEAEKQESLLIGVSFALLDFAEAYRMPLHHTQIMETGGMKGRREEITRDQLHSTLKDSFSVQTIYSEYGMTELLSQAYSLADGKFQTPPWMKILLRDVNDPFQFLRAASGVINVIDLANLDSCSFIATEDLGKINEDGTFEVLGRMDHSDVRGCNLMWGE